MLARNVTVPPEPGNKRFDVFKRDRNGTPRKLGVVMATSEQIAVTRARTLFSRLLGIGEVLFVKQSELV
jgi:1,2-phenylacetyl-CoA epoxidase PaaB subunit